MLRWFAALLWAAGPWRIPLAVAVYLALPASSIVFEILLLRHIVNNYQTAFDWGHFTLLLCLALLFQIFVWLLESFYTQYYAANADLRLVQHCKALLYAKVIKTPLWRLEDKAFYDSYHFSLTHMEARVTDFMQMVETAVSSVAMLVTILSLILSCDAWLLLFVAAPLAVEYALAPVLAARRLAYEQQLAQVRRRGQYAQRVLYLRAYAKDLRMTNIKRVIDRLYDDCILQQSALIRRHGLPIAGLQCTVACAFQLVGFFGALLLVSWRVLGGQMELGAAVVLVTSFNDVIFSAKNIMDIYMNGVQQGLYLTQLFDFLQGEEDPVPSVPLPFPDHIETLAFCHVSYRYPGADHDALRDVSFTLRKGEHVAVVGYNGAGKSTLLKLLLRLYQPTRGQILLNGIDIRHFDLRTYRQNIGAVKQHFVIFAADLEHNVLLHPIQNDDDQRRYDAAIAKSGFAVRHSRLPKGSKTVVTREFDEEGEDFSGGEMQKLAIARALAAGAKLLVMDEATSALDPISEDRFMKEVFQSFPDKLLLLVSHSLSMTKGADRILFLQQGQLIEQGTHADLLAQNGVYAAFYKMQARFFAEKQEEKTR